MKCTTREQCIQRYGPIDFGSCVWPNQRQETTMLEIDPTWFPTWLIGGTKSPVKHILVNIDMLLPLSNALKAVHDQNLGSLLKTYDGCLNIRMVRGSNDHFSAHSYALAIDLNCEENQLSAVSGGFYDHPDFVKCFTDQKLDWGGYFHNRRDPMHFSYCFE